MLLATLRSHRLWTLCFLAWLVVAFNRSAMASTEKYWELSPYRVKLHLVVEDSSVPQPRLGSQLAEQLAKANSRDHLPALGKRDHTYRGIKKKASTRYPATE